MGHCELISLIPPTSQAAREGTAVNIEKYGIINTAINTIVNTLQGENWVRLLSRCLSLFSVRIVGE